MAWKRKKVICLPACPLPLQVFSTHLPHAYFGPGAEDRVVNTTDKVHTVTKLMFYRWGHANSLICKTTTDWDRPYKEGLVPYMYGRGKGSFTSSTKSCETGISVTRFGQDSSEAMTKFY